MNEATKDREERSAAGGKTNLRRMEANHPKDQSKGKSKTEHFHLSACHNKALSPLCMSQYCG